LGENHQTSQGEKGAMQMRLELLKMERPVYTGFSISSSQHFRNSKH
jgi:hypothetical protein